MCAHDDEDERESEAEEKEGILISCSRRGGTRPKNQRVDHRRNK
jgi:hypothetical protein